MKYQDIKYTLDRVDSSRDNNLPITYVIPIQSGACSVCSQTLKGDVIHEMDEDGGVSLVCSDSCYMRYWNYR